MDEHALREMIPQVRTGRLGRRQFQNVVVIPVLWRNGVSASAARLRGMDLTGWDSTMRHLPYWHKV